MGGTLELSVNDNSNVTYLWTGPGGYTSTGPTLSRPNATTAMAGTYRVTATANGCTSEPATTEVKVDTPVTNNHISLSAATSGSLRATVNENGNVVMNAPAGTIFTSVQFASYGTPTDNNGTFSTSNCHAPNSKAIVESYLLGKSTATIPATNAVFTDPCVGTGKRLYVQATYQATTPTICSGTNPGIIPGSSPKGGASTNQFLWESSTTGATEGFSAAAGTYNTKDYNPGNLEKTTWFRRKVVSGSCSVISNTLRIDVKQAVTVPSASNNGPLCTGATLNLYATEVAGATYQWTGPNNYSSTLRNPVITNVSAGHAGTYFVTASVDGCTSKAGNTTVTLNPIIPSTGDENLAGTDSWIGHVYEGTSFETYMGTYTEPETFVQGFGGNEVCFGITSTGNPTSIYTETFSVRYLNNSTKNGLYVADLTSDDGIRFKVNGEIIHDNWIPRSPTTDANVLLNLDQQDNLLTYEYYENSGGNVAQFQNLRKVTDNILTGGTNQTVCEDKTAQPIVGDAIGLVSGITTLGTGYQWVYSTTENGDKIEIPGANQKDFTPDLTAAPFNTPGEYFIYRLVNIQSTNNRLNGVDNYTTTHTSNAANLIIGQIPQVQITANPMELCEGGNVEFSAIFTGSGSYMVTIEVNGTSMGSIPVNDNNLEMPYAVNVTSIFRVTSITDQITGCINNSPNASLTIEVDQPINSNTIEGNQELCGNKSMQPLTGSTPQGGDGTFTYEWLSSTSGPNEGFISIGNTNNKDFNPIPLSETTWFKRKVTSGVCAESVSNAVKITFYDEITNNIINYSGETGNVCIGSSALEIIGSQPTGGNESFTYLWETNTTGPNSGFTPAPGTNTQKDYQPETLLETTWFRRIVTSTGSCTENISEPIRINPLPTATVEFPEVVCSGQPASITGYFTGTGPWKVSVNMGTSNPLDFTIYDRNFTENIPITQSTNFVVNSISDLGTDCINTNPEISFTIAVNNEWEWTGTEDTDWNNPANWSCNQIPTLQNTVLIPARLSNYPEINSGAAALSKDISIENGASVLVDNYSIYIAGKISNSGVFDAKNGHIWLAGNSAQTVPAETFADNRIKNLTLNNSSGVVSQGALEITGILKAQSGHFDTGNNLTLISDEVQTALIDGSGSGEITGTVKMQRYLDNSFGYKYFSSPFQNSTVGDFTPYINLKESFPNFYSYNENREDSNGNDATGWEEYTSINSPINTIEGYAMNFGDSIQAQTVEISGIVNNGIFSRTLYNHSRTYTQGFNLVGNPYPSPIDWEATNGWTKTNIDDAIYFFTAGTTDRYTGTYSSYVNGIQSEDGKSSNIIPSMQGFFVHVSDVAADVSPTVGTLGMTNSVRVNNFTQPFLKQSAKQTPALIRITAGFEGEQSADPTVIYFNSYATTGFEKKLDAHKLMNTAINVPNFYSFTPKREKLAISAISNSIGREPERIPLGIKTDRAGAIAISLKDTENLSTGAYLYLVDEEKRIVQDLNNDPVYRFHVQKGETNSRFYLVFSNTRISDPAVIYNEPFSAETRNGQVLVRMNLEEGERGPLQISTVTGQIISVLEVAEKEVVEVHGIRSTGVYFISYLSGKETFTKKVLVKK
ncbi:hypothetical protein GCM10007103_10850 [Salinimicrobium marinum]|uniref:SUEL-type lectin domain-containing protein n=1 Tax=Salinimicrobium marinum TaxID=680283 RepID=A0A918SC18_9FLAO|nr:hypothetical protein GCM10007103_10850 [Salinimicrobium marinum]